MSTVSPELGADDLLRAAAACRATLHPALNADWSVRAGDLDWDCRRTLDHIVDSLALYSAYFATRATGRLPIPRNGDPAASVPDLLTTVGNVATIFAEVIRAAPPRTRAFHPAGMADASGYAAMGCEEILVHTFDIAQGLGLAYRPPDDLARRIVARIFPWAPTDGDPWAALLWAAGRAALPDRARLSPDWSWHPAPLAEWDGTIKRRTAPPAWR